MPQQAWSAKRERQYEHIKDGLEDQGTGEKKGEGDRGAHRQQGARAQRRGQDVFAALPRGHLLGPSRRAPVGDEPREGADPRPAVRGGQEQGHQGPLEDDEGPAAARGRREEAVAVLRLSRQMNLLTLDHVALWVADRGRMADAAVERLGVRVIEQTERFTLLGADARRGKLTLFDAEGPRERGPLQRIGLRVSSLDGREPSRRPRRGARARARRGRDRLGARPRSRFARLSRIRRRPPREWRGARLRGGRRRPARGRRRLRSSSDPGDPGDAGAAAAQPHRRARRLGRGAPGRGRGPRRSRSTTSSMRRTRSRSSSGARTA